MLKRLAGRLAFAMMANATCLAAQAPAYNHWKAIDDVLAEIGGIDKVSAASERQLNTLAGHLLLRAQFFQDLYEYSTLVVRDHAMLRDSIGRHGGAKTTAAPYFLARALHEMGRRKEAAAAYRRIPASAPAEIRNLAGAWNATLGTAAVNGWQADVVRWRDGKDASSTGCPAAQTDAACALFRAIVSKDAPGTLRIEQQLMQSPQPSYRETVKAKGGSFVIEFIDPLTFYLLSQADYALAAHALARARGGEAARGIALLRSGRPKEAADQLRIAVPAGSPSSQLTVFMGEALYRSGHSAEADQQWKGTTGATANVLVDVRGNLGIDSNAALQQYRAESTRGLARMRDPRENGAFLARALLRQQRAMEALELLESVRPVSYGTDLNRVSPDVLVLISRARYVVGDSLRDNFPLARGEIAALATDFPIVRQFLRLLQEVTMPPNIGDARSRN